MATKYKVLEIAHFFLSKIDSEKGDSITPLKLQKLVYYAQAWHYTVFNEALFDDKIEAWTHGPVVRSLWEKFKDVGKDTFIDTARLDVAIVSFSNSTRTLLEEVNKIYGEHSGSYLEDLTHSEAPWKDARGNSSVYAASTNEITLKSLKAYYSQLRNGKK
jgi:uncharacterized phage-associated protein